MRTKFAEISEVIRIPIYEENITVILTNNLPRVVKRYEIDGNLHKRTEGLFVELEDEIVCVFRLPVSINCAVHETSHICDLILQSRGVQADGEARAYLIGFLAEKIWEIIEKYKK